MPYIIVSTSSQTSTPLTFDFHSQPQQRPTSATSSTRSASGGTLANAPSASSQQSVGNRSQEDARHHRNHQKEKMDTLCLMPTSASKPKFPPLPINWRWFSLKKQSSKVSPLGRYFQRFKHSPHEFTVDRRETSLEVDEYHGRRRQS